MEKIMYCGSISIPDKILEVIVINETPELIQIKGASSKRKKITQYECFKNTKQEVKDWLLSHFNNELEILNKRKERIVNKIESVNKIST